MQTLSYLRPDRPAATPSQADLCVALERAQSSVTRGHAADWIVSVSAENGSVSDVSVLLKVAPTSQKSQFTFGCSTDGKTSCDLKTVDSTSNPDQLQAAVTVPTTATSVKSVTLTAIASGTDVKIDPQAAVTVSVTAPPKSSPSTSASPSSSSGSPSTSPSISPVTPSTGTSTTTTTIPPSAFTTPLSVGNLPFLNGSGSTLSPGGNAAGLFPTLSPSGSGGTSQSGVDGARTSTRAMADTSALPEGNSVIGAQIVGLGALAVAFILAVTRLSVRRRPATTGPAKAKAPKDPGNDPK